MAKVASDSLKHMLGVGTVALLIIALTLSRRHSPRSAATNNIVRRADAKATDPGRPVTENGFCPDDHPDPDICHLYIEGWRSEPIRNMDFNRPDAVSLTRAMGVYLYDSDCKTIWWRMQFKPDNSDRLAKHDGGALDAAANLNSTISNLVVSPSLRGIGASFAWDKARYTLDASRCAPCDQSPLTDGAHCCSLPFRCRHPLGLPKTDGQQPAKPKCDEVNCFIFDDKRIKKIG